MNIKKFKNILVITFFITLFSHDVQAYVDPNAGGFFFTSVLPFVYGILAAVVIFWKRIAQFVKNIFSRKEDKGDD
jgi:hypothetical protein